MENVNLNLTDDQKIFRNRELPLRQRMEAWINHVASFYTTANRSTNSGRCVYSPSENSPGCAIGKEDPVFAQFDGLSEAAIDTIIGGYSPLLPNWILDFGINFLSDLQYMHDYSRNWDADGLSSDGMKVYRNFLNDISAGKYDHIQTEHKYV